MYHNKKNIIQNLLFGKTTNIDDEVYLYYSPLKIVDLIKSKQFNCDEYQKYRSNRICTDVEASSLFEFILGREGGVERQGFTVENIINDLIDSKEFYTKHDTFLFELLQKNSNDIVLDQKFKFLKCNTPLVIKFIEARSSRLENHETAILELLEVPSLTLEKIPFNQYFLRLQAFIRIFENFLITFPNMTGSNKKILISLGDAPCLEQCVSFCSNKLHDYLIPDPEFIEEKGYKHLHQKYLKFSVWSKRINKAYWRGADTSTRNYNIIQNAPRVRLSILSNMHQDYLDAGIVSVEKTHNYGIKVKLFEELNIFRDRDPQEMMLNYKYQIDVDGNSNAWRSFYLKLLSGSPVLKVESEFGYQQWYYHRLIPWVHYVPVNYDCSDLIEKIDFLRENPTLAEYIGQQGQKFALSMTYEEELDTAVGVLMKAFNNI